MVLRLGFDALLRPVELVECRRSSVVLPSQPLFGFGRRSVVAIKDPKTKASVGRVQFATFDDDCTIQWLEWFTAGLPPRAKLFAFGTAGLRNLFGKLMEMLCFGRLRVHA